jgi:hypothetical protein
MNKYSNVAYNELLFVNKNKLSTEKKIQHKWPYVQFIYVKRPELAKF